MFTKLERQRFEATQGYQALINDTCAFLYPASFTARTTGMYVDWGEVTPEEILHLVTNGLGRMRHATAPGGAGVTSNYGVAEMRICRSH